MKTAIRKSLDIFFWIVCLLGGLGSFLTWLNVKPTDLLQMTPTTPRIVWLLLSLFFWGVCLWSSLRAGFFQRREISRLHGSLLQTQELAQQCKSDLQESAKRNLEYREKLAMFTKLQMDALLLSTNLLQFIEDQGPPPIPKYSLQQIEKMPSAQERQLIDSHDPDFDFACAFWYGGADGLEGGARTAEQLEKLMLARFRLLDPWYEKITAAYELEFRQQVEEMRNKFAIEHIQNTEVLQVPVRGKMGLVNIEAIASKLWELAYTIRKKRIEIEPSTA